MSNKASCSLDVELPFFRIAKFKKNLVGGDWLIQVIRNVGTYSQGNKREHYEFGFSLTFRLVLCYDGHRLSRPLQRSRSLFMRCSTEVNAIHLEKETREF